MAERLTREQLLNLEASLNASASSGIKFDALLHDPSLMSLEQIQNMLSSEGVTGVLAELTIGTSITTLAGADTEAHNKAFGSSSYSPISYWKDGRTVIPYMKRAATPYNQAVAVLAYDAGYGVLRPYEVTPANISGDEHGIPSVTIDSDGHIYVTQERVHNTPINLYKSRFTDDTTAWEHLAEAIGDDVGYTSLTKVGDNYSAWVRFFLDTLNYNAAIYLSTNGMENWGSRVDITEAPSDGRHYPSLPTRNHADGWYYYELTNRIETDAIWRSKYILKTQDHITWYNYQGTFSKNVVTNGVITVAELNTNFRYYDTGDNAKQGHNTVSAVSPQGQFVSVTGDGAGNYYFVYYDSGWQTKAITITDMMNGDDIGGDAQGGPFGAMISYSNTKHDLFVRKSVTVNSADYGHFFLYRTEDNGTTWDEVGDLTPDLEAHAYRITIPGNLHEVTGNFAIGISEVGNPSPLHIVTMAFGLVTEDSQTLDVTPVDSLSDVTNLVRHYKVSSGTVTKTGTTLDSLVDQSGSAENATTEGSPALNDGTTPTFVTLDGTNDGITIPTTDLTALEEMTLVAVVRKKSSDSGTSGIILAATNNTGTTRFVNIGLINQDTFNYSVRTMTRNNEGTQQEYWGDENAISDTDFKIVTIVIDGSNIQQHINGRKQYFHANTAEARQLTGRCFADVTGMNTLTIGSYKRSTPSYTAIDVKEWALYSRAISENERRQIEKKLATDHSITLSEEYI